MDLFVEGADDIDDLHAERYCMTFMRPCSAASRGGTVALLLVIANLLCNFRMPVPKVETYAEATVPQMRDSVFQSHFRLNRSTMERLTLLLGPRIGPDEITRGRPQVEPSKQIMVAVWCVANMESFR